MQTLTPPLSILCAVMPCTLTYGVCVDEKHWQEEESFKESGTWNEKNQNRIREKRLWIDRNKTKQGIEGKRGRVPSAEGKEKSKWSDLNNEWKRQKGKKLKEKDRKSSSSRAWCYKKQILVYQQQLNNYKSVKAKQKVSCLFTARPSIGKSHRCVKKESKKEGRNDMWDSTGDLN